MSRLLPLALVVACLSGFLAVAGVLLLRRAEAGRGMPAYSVYSEGPDGLGLAAGVLRQAGWRCVALTRPVHQTERRGLLVVVEPTAGAVHEAVAAAMLKWVARGNTLLVCARTTTPLHQRLGVVVTRPAREGDSFTPVALAGTPYTEDMESLAVGTEATLSVPRNGARVLWRVRGAAGAVSLPYGRGKVLLVGDPTLLTRHGLVRDDGEPREDNVVFVVNVARLEAQAGVVLFDEYHHGFRAGTGFWSYLGHRGARWALLPVLIVAGVALWRGGVRLGPARPLPAQRRADAVDFAAALARLYQQVGTRGLLARILVRDFLGTLTRHVRLRRVALPALILSAWRQQHPGPADRLQELLKGVAELRKGEVPDRELLTRAQAFDRFIRATIKPG
jgi:hypothetical protein